MMTDLTERRSLWPSAARRAERSGQDDRRSWGGAALCLAWWGLLGAGCGLDYAGTMNNNGNGNWPDGSVECLYTVAVSPPSPQIGNTVTLEAQGSAGCAPSPQDGYAWSITGPGGGTVTPTLRQSGRIAEMTPGEAGTYRVGLVVTDLHLGQRSVERLITVVRPGAAQTTFRLLLSPPEDVDAPRQIRTQVVYGGTPVDGLLLALEQGVQVTGQVTAEGAPVPGYVRFTLTGFDLMEEVRADAAGHLAVSLLGDGLYDVMVVPEEASPAPVRLEGMTAADLLQADAFALSPGVTVLGYVQDASGGAVADARVVLRSAGLPSSVATTDSFDGRFVLRARPGPQGLEVEPEAGSGWPRLRVPEDAGILLGASDALALTVRYDAGLTLASPTITVTAASGGAPAPVPGVRVTLEATDLGALGTVSITRDGSDLGELSAAGSVRRSGTTDASGALALTGLPVGRYRVLLEPPAETPAAVGPTVVQTLDITGLHPTMTLPLSAPAHLEGWVVNDLLEPVEDAHVVAVTPLGVGSAAEAWSEADGYFSLEVIQGATYQVILSAPAGGQPFARMALPEVRVTSENTALQGAGPAGELVLRPGLALTGRVAYQGNPVGGALIQAIAVGVSGAPVLAEAVTDANGGFRIVVPDPGMSE